jgi:hypothetical protein
LTGYYGNYPGVQLAPIGRFYFKAHAPEGFYAQAKVVGAFHSRIVIEDKKQSFTSFGGGIALGYQLLFGKNDKWVIDLNLGAKFVNPIPDPDPEWGVIDLDRAAWILTGPGSIVDGLISIGLRF